MKINTGRYELDLITATIASTDQVQQSTVIDKISVDMFTSNTTRRAWEAIKVLRDENRIIDIIGTSEHMGNEGDFLWLAEIISDSAALPSNITGYAKRVRQSSYLLNARERLLESIKVIDELTDVTQVKTVAGSIEAVFDGLLLETNDKKPQLFKDVAKDYLDKIDDKLNGKVDEHIVMSGIPDLDAKTGGFNLTDLIVLAGLSGSGKTEKAISIIRGITSNGNGALMFSLEMSNQQVVERSISGEAQLPVSSLRNPADLTQNGWSRLSQGYKELLDRKIYMDDQSNLSIDDIITRSKRHKRDNPDCLLIVVDHVGLMQLSKNESRHDLQVGEISRKLKVLAKDIKTPVLLLSQLTGKKVMDRPLMEREPRAQDIKDSSRIEEDADLILLCHRQWTHDDTAPNIAELILAKARHAIKGTKVYFRFCDGHFVPTAQDMASNDMDVYKNKNTQTPYKKSSKLN